jgi:phage shock protein A
MGILKRLREIIEGNIHDQLDKVDDPEIRINQILRDLEAGLVEIRQSLAQAMANHHISGQNCDTLRKEAQEWEEHAMRALKAGDEALARKALEKKVYYKNRIQMAEEQVADDAALVEQVRKDMLRLEERFHEVRARRDTLVARSRGAKARGRVINVSDKMNGGLPGFGQVDDAVRRMDDLERQLDYKHAEYTAKVQLATEGLAGDVERQVKSLKAKDDLEAELAALKAKLGRSLSGSHNESANETV